MLSSEPSPFAQDADTTMRAAARLVLQQHAAGVSRARILAQLEGQGFLLPDPESFVDALTREKRVAAAEEPEEQAVSGAVLFAGALLGVVCLGWLVAWSVTFGASMVNIGYAVAGGKIVGGAVGLWATLWCRDRQSAPLFQGGVAGLVLYSLSAVAVVVIAS
jgi:hypothetical protein